MADNELTTRKNDHLDIVLDPLRTRTGQRAGFAAWRFEHCALPELHLDAVDLSASLFGRPLAAPLLIGSMTGGARRAETINRHLAEAAQELGIALAVGSQRVALESGATSHGLTDEVRNGYQRIRAHFSIAGDAPAETLQAIVEQSRARSAVYDVLTNGVPVDLTISTSTTSA